MNKKMKVFPPEMPDYEKVFTSPKFLGRFRMNRVNIPEGFKDITEYKNAFKEFSKWVTLQLWDVAVRTEWMFDKFQYRGRRAAIPTVGVESRYAFSVFTKEFVGVNFDFASTSFCVRKVKNYFKELFPNFHKDNPFLNPEKYQYPFKHVTMDFLMLVYQIPEKMDLLSCAEKDKMNYTTFIDFVINYIGKCNDAAKKDMFLLVKTQHFPLYVKCLKK